MEETILECRISVGSIRLLKLYRSRMIFGKEFKKLFRNISCGYAARPDVREFVLCRDNHQCRNCCSSTDLQIDHIIPVASATQWKYQHINTLENLQVLCKSCNISKIDHRDGQAR